MNDDYRDVVAVWKGGTTFIADNTKGGMVQMGPLEDRPGIGPMELLLAGLAGCSGIDVIEIMQKKRQEVQDFKIKVHGLRAKDFPRVYTEIEIEYLLWGENLDPKAVEQAIRLSEEKYCSASAMLGAVAEIRSRYRILQPGQTEFEKEMAE